LVERMTAKFHDDVEIYIVVVVSQHISDSGDVLPWDRRMLGLPEIWNAARSLGDNLDTSLSRVAAGPVFRQFA
jgi:hypothetical protein